MFSRHDEAHFHKFAASLVREIAKYNEDEEAPSCQEKRDQQKEQVDGICREELLFRQFLVENDVGYGIYDKFVKFICDEKKNILAARPYFRERQSVFTESISGALKSRDISTLKKFHFNYGFMQFAMEHGGSAYPELVEINRRHSAIRNELVEVNLPLVISRARIFWSRTPKSHLSYMDLVQTGCEGLLAAVDKFVPPYTPVFRSVAIGRMHGNFIEKYSDTEIHFYPVDRRKIYRAHKVLGKMGGLADVNYDDLAAVVNVDMEGSHLTNGVEIAGLLAAASTLYHNVTQSVESGEETDAANESVADESARPDVQFEEAELYDTLTKAVSQLPLVLKKVLKMRGIVL